MTGVQTCALPIWAGHAMVSFPPDGRNVRHSPHPVSYTHLIVSGSRPRIPVKPCTISETGISSSSSSIRTDEDTANSFATVADVYKRQMVCCNSIDLAGLTAPIDRLAVSLILMAVSLPVSYTHLDVYKRQTIPFSSCFSALLICSDWRNGTGH